MDLMIKALAYADVMAGRAKELSLAEAQESIDRWKVDTESPARIRAAIAIAIVELGDTVAIIYHNAVVELLERVMFIEWCRPFGAMPVGGKPS